MKYIFFQLLVVITVFQTFGQPIGESRSQDLKSEWLQYINDGYLPVEADEDLNTIYLQIATSKFAGGDLVIQSSRPYFIFLDGKLVGEHDRSARLSLDSLRANYSSSFLIAVHQQNINQRDLKTFIETPSKTKQSTGLAERPKSFFKDFVIFAGLIIIIGFLAITRLNPKLAADYLSVMKIFSMREAEDAQANARLTSSTNIQFYVWCSLLLGFCLLIIFNHLPDSFALPLQFQATSFGMVLWQWVRLSFIILGIFFLKIIIVYTSTRLFGMGGLARIHFFNWVRLVLIIFAMTAIILFLYFIWHGQNPTFFSIFFSIVIGILTAWVLIVFMKLNGKTEHSMFHLFSYICATELIPLLITIKVLFQ
jgi:hypothetical protein